MTLALGVLTLVLAITAGVLALRLARVRKERDRLRQMARRYAESATHELHTPITAILGYQELLSEGIYGPLPGQATEAVNRIGRATGQLMYLVDGLLDAVLLDAGPIETRERAVQLNDLFAQVMEDGRGVAVERGATLVGSVPEALPTISTDPERVRRLLGLALMAAVRASPGRTLHIGFRAGDGTAGLEVDGTGLTPAALDVDEVVPGADRLSLRLAVAKRTARALGGDAVLEPDGNASTTLRIWVAAH